MGGTIRPPSGETVPDPLPSFRGPEATNPTMHAGVPPMSMRDPAVSIRTSMPSVNDLPLVCPTCGVRYPVEFKVCPRDATELADARTSEPEDPLIGQTLAGTYAITRVIGEGGMGRVYEARHLRIGGKRFAIKALHEEYVRNKEVLTRFQREAEAASSIPSPHVVEVYDVLRADDGRPFMVAEFLHGKELGDHLLDLGRMTVEEAIPIARQICAGLAAAHAKGIIHRDMKPENIFLVGDLKHPTVKILDFGISKSGDAPGTQLTKTGVIMGTPSFMAPEQARGEKITHLVDVYSMGAILYAMITGRRPFDKNDPTATLTALLLEEPPRPRSLDPAIPEAIEVVIQKAMAKSPADRYQSIDALDHDLAPFLEHHEAKAAESASRPLRTVSDAEITSERSRLARALPLAAVFAFGAVALVMAGALRLSHGATSKATLSGGQTIFMIVVPLAIIATAVGFGAAYVRGIPSEEAKRSSMVSSVLQFASAVGLLTLGFGFLFVRFMETLVLHRAVGAAWPAWEVMMPLLAMAGAVLAGLLVWKERNT